MLSLIGNLFKTMAAVEQFHGSWSFKLGPTDMSYEGDYIINEEGQRVKHGTGTLRWSDGREYRGQFARDKLHGEGSMSWPTGEKYEGQYVNNYKSGLGKLLFPDASTFEGAWYNGKRHGEFVCHDPRCGSTRIEFELDAIVRTEAIPEQAGWTFKPGYDTYVKSEGSCNRCEGEVPSKRSLEPNKVGCCEPCTEPTCCICIGDLCVGDTCTRLPCGHEFHKSCIDTWTVRKLQCPLCREKIHLHKLLVSTEVPPQPREFCI